VVDDTVDDLLDNLGVAGRIAIVDEVTGRLAVNDLPDAVAVAVVEQGDVPVAAVALRQAVLAIVAVGAANR
jgi:hypothetical protein